MEAMGLIVLLCKTACFLLYCLCSGVALTLGAKDSNLRVYYLFSALLFVGVILL